LGGRKGIRPVKTERWVAGVVICLERGADLHTAQLMPLPLTVYCLSKIQIGFTFLVPAHPGSPEQRAIKWMYVVTAAMANKGGAKTKKIFLCQLNLFATFHNTDHNNLTTLPLTPVQYSSNDF